MLDRFWFAGLSHGQKKKTLDGASGEKTKRPPLERVRGGAVSSTVCAWRPACFWILFLYVVFVGGAVCSKRLVVHEAQRSPRFVLAVADFLHWAVPEKRRNAFDPIPEGGRANLFCCCPFPRTKDCLVVSCYDVPCGVKIGRWVCFVSVHPPSFPLRVMIFMRILAVFPGASVACIERGS